MHLHPSLASLLRIVKKNKKGEQEQESDPMILPGRTQQITSLDVAFSFGKEEK